MATQSQSIPKLIREMSVDGEAFVVAQYDSPELTLLSFTKPTPLLESARYLRGCWTFELAHLSPQERALVVAKRKVSPPPNPPREQAQVDAIGGSPEELAIIADLRKIQHAEVIYQASSYAD